MKYETAKAYIDARTEFELAKAPFPAAVQFQNTIEGVVGDVAGALRMSAGERKALRGYVEARATIFVSRTANAVKAAGERAALNGAVPVTYWGVWKDGNEYRFGNMVTDAGCLWHCEAEKVTDRPGKSPNWKLMHKSHERAGR
jgi:hypothetical protein